MPLVSPIRVADANNTRATANLAIGGIWTGVATYTGAARYHAEVTMTCVQAGTLEVLQGETAATCTTVVETIAIAAATTGVMFWFPVTSAWYCLRYTQGGVAGNVTIGTIIDPRDYATVRRNDPNNSRATAALGNGATWTGVGTLKMGYERVDITLTNAATGTLTFEESDDGTTWTVVETWTATAATHAFPTPLSRRFYRFQFLDTGGGGNLTVRCELDPRAVDHEIPLSVVQADNLINGAMVSLTAPLGARSVLPGQHMSANNRRAANAVRIGTRNATTTVGIAEGENSSYCSNIRIPIHSDGTTIIDIDNQSGANIDYTVFWYP